MYRYKQVTHYLFLQIVTNRYVVLETYANNRIGYGAALTSILNYSPRNFNKF